MDDTKSRGVTWRISEGKIAKRKNRRLFLKYIIPAIVLANVSEHGIFIYAFGILLAVVLFEYLRNRSNYGNGSMVELNTIAEDGVHIQGVKMRQGRIYKWNNLSDFYIVRKNFIGFISSILGIDIVLSRKGAGEDGGVIWLYFENEMDKLAVASELSKHLPQKM